MGTSLRAALAHVGIAGLLVAMASADASAGLFHRRARTCEPRRFACAAPRARCRPAPPVCASGPRSQVMLPAWGPCRANVQSISVDCVAAPYPVNTRRTFVAYAAAGYDLSTCSPQDIHIVDAVDLLGTSYIPWDAATVVSKTASHVTFTSTPRSSVFSASGGVTVTIGSTSVYCRVPVF